jgi:hypothetical protein
MATMSRGAIQDLVAKFAAQNPKYRDALIKDPKSVLEKQLNTRLPAGVKVKAAVETADTAYVIVPHVPGQGELSDADLERVAGGFADKNAECDRSPGAANTMTIINL